MGWADVKMRKEEGIYYDYSPWYTWFYSLAFITHPKYLQICQGDSVGELLCDKDRQFFWLELKPQIAHFILFWDEYYIFSTVDAIHVRFHIRRRLPES